MHIRRNALVATAGVLIIVPFVALAWTGPTASPPNGNVAPPINVGTTDQVKNGGLGVNSLAVFGNAILNGVGRYFNFGPTAGTDGYGIRDNAGLLEFKNSGGSWQSLQSVIFTLAGAWMTSGNDIYNSNTGNVGIGTASPGAKLDVNGGIHPGSASTGASCSGNPEGTFAYDTSAHAPVYCNQSGTWDAVGGSAGTYSLVTQTGACNAWVSATCPAGKNAYGGSCTSTYGYCHATQMTSTSYTGVSWTGGGADWCGGSVTVKVACR